MANEPIHTPSGPVSATISMGVTVTAFGPDLTAADILHQADVALYKAKNNGRNRSEVFSAAAGHSIGK